MKAKHNKKRNTAFLYETLTRELTKCIVEKDDERKKVVLDIVKEHFKKGTLLYREKVLFDALLESGGLDEISAEKLVAEAKKTHSRLDKKELFREQSRLIESVNRKLSRTVYKNFVPNYKSLASIAQIFNEETPIKTRVLLEQKIVENLSVKKEVIKEENLKPIDKLVFKTFVKRFNTEYDGTLSEEQKQLISHYIMSIDDNGLGLKTYLNEEIGRLKDKVKKAVLVEEINNDKSMSESVRKVSDILDGMKERPVDQEMVKQILKIQAFVEEAERN